MKLISACLLALALLCLADAQGYKNTQKPQPKPYTPPQVTQPQTPQQPEQPQAKRPPQPQQPLTELPNSCDVNEQDKIACGLPGISSQECENINCCFDGRMCFYGKSATLQCTKDAQMIVVVSRSATVPHLDLETISFLGDGPNCSPVGTTSAFAIYQFPVTACGTTLLDYDGVLTYENRMTSSFEVAIGEKGIITRDSSYQLLVQCRYIGTSVEALVIEVGTVPPPPPVAAPGPVQVQLRLANGQCLSKGCVEEDVAYNSYYTYGDYPVQKVLRDAVYVDVNLMDRTDPNMALTLGHCWATSDPYPQSLPQWDLLIDGCPYRDDRYQTSLVQVVPSADVPCPSHHKRFIFKMFTFVSMGSGSTQAKGDLKFDAGNYTPLKEKVYIHCETAVCKIGPGNNCEPRCFRKRRSIEDPPTNVDEVAVVSSSLIEYSN